MANDYEILEELENIFKASVRTKEYTIEAASEPDNVPNPNICPMVNIFPTTKPRELVRMSGTPYTSYLSFDIMVWEMSLAGYKSAFKLVSLAEENVFQVLLANKNVSSTVLTSVIEETVYEHMYYEDSFYIKAVIPFVVQKDQ